MWYLVVMGQLTVHTYVHEYVHSSELGNLIGNLMGILLQAVQCGGVDIVLAHFK